MESPGSRQGRCLHCTLSACGIFLLSFFLLYASVLLVDALSYEHIPVVFFFFSPFFFLHYPTSSEDCYGPRNMLLFFFSFLSVLVGSFDRVDY